MNNLANTASSYAHAGLSVIPTLADKRPACAWKQYTERIMSDREIDMYFGGGQGADRPTDTVGSAPRADRGIGIICGKVSGNLELLDFDDGGSAFEPWFCAIPDELARRLVIEQSPSGGKHVYYRVSDGYDVPGNRKLAMKADGHVLIETRGESGYVKCAPSTEYTLTSGDFLHVPTVTPFEQKLMIDAALALDEKIRTQATSSHANFAKSDLPTPGGIPPSAESAFREVSSCLTPWEDYNRRGDIASLLEAHGWKRTKGGDNEHWERPGKDERSTSATWNGTVFFVFSSNAWGFEPNKGYNRFQVFATLECGGDTREAARRLRSQGFGGGFIETALPKTESFHCSPSSSTFTSGNDTSPIDPGAVPEELLCVPGFVNLLSEHTLATAPYPNRPLAFAGALTMLAHLTGRNYRDARNLRTNCYLIGLAESGLGKDYPRKVNMNLAAEVGIMPTMADRFASAEGLEDALLVHPASFFQVDEVDTLFSSLQDKKDSSVEKIYGSLLQFATSADTTYAMRKKAIQQTGGKGAKFEKVRARGIREPHLTLFGCAIPKYFYSALSERALECGLTSRCVILEAGPRGRAGTPHFAPFDSRLLTMARSLVAHGGFDGLDLDKLEEEPPPYIEPITVPETPEALQRHNEIVAECETLYDAATTTAEKALWTRGAEKAARLALLYAISENVENPLLSETAVDWGWRLVEHLTRRTLYQASVYVHDNEFDALRQKALRQIRNYGGQMTHGQLLRNMHIDSDTMRRVVETLVQSELIAIIPLEKGGMRYCLR